MNVDKIGMEVEYEYKKHKLPRCFMNDYVISTHFENEKIKELRIRPIDFREQERLLDCYYKVTKYTTKVQGNRLMFDRGQYTFYAGSNHLHISFKKPIMGYLNDSGLFYYVWLPILPFMARNDYGFRDQTFARFVLRPPKIVFGRYDSKTYFVTLKNHSYLEIRINENPFPVVLYLLIPLIENLTYDNSSPVILALNKYLEKTSKSFMGRLDIFVNELLQKNMYHAVAPMLFKIAYDYFETHKNKFDNGNIPIHILDLMYDAIFDKDIHPANVSLYVWKNIWRIM